MFFGSWQLPPQERPHMRGAGLILGAVGDFDFHLGQYRTEK